MLSWFKDCNIIDSFLKTSIESLDNRVLLITLSADYCSVNLFLTNITTPNAPTPRSPLSLKRELKSDKTNRSLFYMCDYSTLVLCFNGLPRVYLS